MGITSSTPDRELSQDQQDVKFLGERMPFGDEELYQVYRAYKCMKQIPLEERISFVTDIGVQSVPLSERDGRMTMLQAVEHKLLTPDLGNRLYEVAFLRSPQDSEYSETKPPTEDDSYVKRAKLEAFFDGLSNCSRRGNNKALKILFDCCQPQTTAETSNASTAQQSTFVADGNSHGGSGSGKHVDPKELVTIGYRVALASGFLRAASKDDGQDVSRFFPQDNQDGDIHPEADSGLKALAESLIEFCNRQQQRARVENPATTHVNFDQVLEWSEQVAPMFGSCLATLTHMLFFPSRPYPPTRTSFDFPDLSNFTSSFISQGSSSLLFTFASMSPALGGEYYRLYTSASDGLSFNRLQNALLGYGGPTLIIIQSGNSVFGAFTASPWKESKDFYGNHDCFLYRLLPTTAVFRPSGNGHNFMYCNSHARSRGYDQQAHGIGFGGTTDQPRLFLAESFDNCRAAPQDLTFESGRLLDDKSSTFEIDNLEVWGVGGTEVVEEALGARNRSRDIRNANIQKARKVDKAQFLDDFRSGLIASKAFQHRDQIRGREGTDGVNEDDLNRQLSKGA